MALKQNWTDKDVITATFLNELVAKVNAGGGSSTVDGLTDASALGKSLAKAANAAAARTAIGAMAKAEADANYAPIDKTLLGWANAGSYSLVTATRNTAGGLTGGTVKWPDGATGTLTTTLSTDSASLNAVNGFVVTHVLSGVTTTFTQPTMTRDATTGAVTAQPELVVS